MVEAHSHSTVHNTMPPRLNVTSLARSMPLRPRPQVQWPVRCTTRFLPQQCRPYSDSTTSGATDRSAKIDAKPEDHVSQEAAKTAEIMGEEGPDLSRGTPVEDVRILHSIGTTISDRSPDCQRGQRGARKTSKGHERQVEGERQCCPQGFAVILDYDDTNRTWWSRHGPRGR
jgi:hypothetical protein